MEKLVGKMSFIRKILGKNLDSKVILRKNARRSLVARRYIPKGKVIEEEDIVIKRPGTGVPTEFYDIVISSMVARDILENEILKFGDFSKSGDWNGIKHRANSD